ncbi:MAG: tryptophan-rich sensory protein [Clostridia bacterium]|nr:tryptophan-rich sensory protein [Clostridia bacterium]
MNKSKIKTYAVSLLIALGVGGVSALLTNMGMENYKMAEKPAFTPPDIVFPIVWTILFLLMGISSARIYLSPVSVHRSRGLLIYVLQLAANFIWSLLFFNLQAYGLAFFWLIFLSVLILLMIIVFSKTDKIAAYLQIPYLLWVSFAGVLNYMVWMLNR